MGALNDVLRHGFDAPGQADFGRGSAPVDQAPIEELLHPGGAPPQPGSAARALVDAAMRFKQSPVRLHPGEQRTISLLVDPARVPPGTSIELASDPGLSVNLQRRDVPEPLASGWCRVRGTLRARVSTEPGSLLSVFAEAGDHEAELVVIVVRQHGSGWVREIARKDDDTHIEAEFEPETGIVTVHEDRRELRALEKAARDAGLARSRVREYVPYRMLEVEVAANAVYWWAAERIVERRLPGERPSDPAEYSAAVRIEAQLLRHRAHDKLMKAFLGPEVFEGTVTVAPRQVSAGGQLRLAGG